MSRFFVEFFCRTALRKTEGGKRTGGLSNTDLFFQIRKISPVRFLTLDACSAFRRNNGCSAGAENVFHILAYADSREIFTRKTTKFPGRMHVKRCETSSGIQIIPASQTEEVNEQEVPIMRVKVTLACTECKRRNYVTKKNKRNNPERIEMNKHCKFCRKHTLHRETK